MEAQQYICQKDRVYPDTWALNNTAGAECVTTWLAHTRSPVEQIAEIANIRNKKHQNKDEKNPKENGREEKKTATNEDLTTFKNH